MIPLSRATPAQRRAAASMLAKLHRPNGPGELYLRHAHEHRVARRLCRAGLAVAVCTKYRPWYRRRVFEITLFPSREAARRRYPDLSPMRER